MPEVTPRRRARIALPFAAAAVAVPLALAGFAAPASAQECDPDGYPTCTTVEPEPPTLVEDEFVAQGGDGDQLAFTGGELWWTVGGAGALLVAGGALVVASRRRAGRAE